MLTPVFDKPCRNRVYNLAVLLDKDSGSLKMKNGNGEALPGIIYEDSNEGNSDREFCNIFRLGICQTMKPEEIKFADPHTIVGHR